MKKGLIMSLLQLSVFTAEAQWQAQGANDTGNSHVVVAGDTRESFDITQDINGCTKVVHDFNPLVHKPKYRVGVYSSEGDEVAHAMYDQVFQEYLTESAGKRFDPPLEFEVVPLSLTELLDMAEDEEVDFLFVSSAVFSCMATEAKAQALATIVNRRESRGYQYDLDVYGGVIFTKAENKDINRIQDLKGRTIGAGAITAMGGGQTQLYEMVKHGLSYVADPKQVIFTKDESLIVQGLLDGEFEVGFARTDQIERHTDENGDPIKDGVLKIINPQTHVLDSGRLFPFVSSTGLHPEWPVGALDHVDRGVSMEVQEALLAVRDHALATQIGENLRCETTPALAELSASAMAAGAFSGFRTPRSYFEVRTKQEKAGFIREDEETGNLKCIRGDTLYHDIECPVGQYKVTEEEFNLSCEKVGLECKEGYECYCQPCIKAFEVDVFQYYGEGQANQTEQGCEKMSVCGNIDQSKEITFRAIDNVKRDAADVKVILHSDEEEDIILPVEQMEPYVYEFRWSQGTIGVGIIEILVDGVQIPESPMRLHVHERVCDADYPGRGMVATENGKCECGSDTVKIGNKCVDNTIIAIAGSLSGVFLLAILGYFYINHRNKKNDQMWQVDLDELHFDDPVEVIGQGSFGVVLVAEYRGTKVAIKRAVKTRKGGSKSTSKSSYNAMDGRTSMGAIKEEEGGSMVISNHSGVSGNSDLEDIEAADPQSKGGASNGNKSATISQHFSLAFMAQDFGRKKSKWAKVLPWLEPKNDYQSRFHQSVLGTASQSASSRTIGQCLFPCFNEQARMREEFQSEMRILARLRHPCITTVMGAVVTRTHDPMLVMEYMEYGSLHDILRNDTIYLGGEIILQVARDLAQGLRYLHTSKPPILHGDLKSRNILLDSRFRAKLCDFGLSLKTEKGISGTPFWLAPEYLRGEKQYDTTCDMYSVGIILYEIFSRKSPYHGEDYREVMRGICNRRVNKRPVIPVTTPPKFVDLMKRCWSPDSNYRPQARDLDMGFLDMNVTDAEPLEEDQLLDYRKRSTDMIYELFPRHVAEAIKKGQKVEPESHDLVTVIFSDIINFTDISRTISPEKVCDMLDRLYTAFDGIARKHQVFKVETIGDAYMGVTNLEKNQEHSHVKQIAEFAVEMINEARKVIIDKDDPSRGYINIRVGFHSGPVVSNVIGTTNKRFSLFGDTVNTSSRMESNSTANRILCSERSYELLKEQAPQIKTKKRGKIQVKGKGDMHVYWVGDNLLKAHGHQNVPPPVGKVGFAEDFSEKTNEHPAIELASSPVSPTSEMRATTDELAAEQAPMQEQAPGTPAEKVPELAPIEDAPTVLA